MSICDFLFLSFQLLHFLKFFLVLLLRKLSLLRILPFVFWQFIIIPSLTVMISERFFDFGLDDLLLVHENGPIRTVLSHRSTHRLRTKFVENFDTNKFLRLLFYFREIRQKLFLLPFQMVVDNHLFLQIIEQLVSNLVSFMN